MKRLAKINLIIGSGSILYRMGMEMLLNEIGVDAEVVEVSSYELLQSAIKADDNVDFVVISDDLLPDESAETLAYLETLAQKKHLMLTRALSEKSNSSLPVIDVYADRDVVVERFESFFYDNMPMEQEESGVLTGREVDILRHVALGLSNKEMADELFISINTVITHRKNITDKLEIKTIAGLTVYAMMHNIIKAEDMNF